MIIIAEEKKPQKINWKFWIFLIAFILLGILWLLTFTNFAAMPIFKITNVPQFQDSIRGFTLFATLIFAIALIGNFWVKDKYSEWSEREGAAVKIVESHQIVPKIKEYASKYYNLKLGECIRIQGLMPHKEAGAVPTTRFFRFENIEYGTVTGYSDWIVHYFRTINIHLYKRYYISRDSQQRYWTGEFRNELHQKIVDTSATKKAREAQNIKPSNQDDNSITQDE